MASKCKFGRHIIGDTQAEIDAFFRRARQPEVVLPLQNLKQVLVGGRQFHAACLDLGEVEHVVHKRPERLAGLEDDLHLLPVFGG